MPIKVSYSPSAGSVGNLALLSGYGSYLDKQRQMAMAEQAARADQNSRQRQLDLQARGQELDANARAGQLQLAARGQTLDQQNRMAGLQAQIQQHAQDNWLKQQGMGADLYKSQMNQQGNYAKELMEQQFKAANYAALNENRLQQERIQQQAAMEREQAKEAARSAYLEQQYNQQEQAEAAKHQATIQALDQFKNIKPEEKAEYIAAARAGLKGLQEKVLERIKGNQLTKDEQIKANQEQLDIDLSKSVLGERPPGSVWAKDEKGTWKMAYDPTKDSSEAKGAQAAQKIKTEAMHRAMDYLKHQTDKDGNPKPYSPEDLRKATKEFESVLKGEDAPEKPAEPPQKPPSGVELPNWAPVPESTRDFLNPNRIAQRQAEEQKQNAPVELSPAEQKLPPVTQSGLKRAREILRSKPITSMPLDELRGFTKDRNVFKALSGKEQEAILAELEKMLATLPDKE